MARVQADEIEEQVWLTVSNVLLDPAIIKQQVASVGGQERNEALEEELLRLRAATRDIERKQARLLLELEDEDMPVGLIKDRIKGNEAERKVLTEKLQQVERSLSDEVSSVQRLDQLQSYIERVGERLGKLGFDDKRLALEALGITVTAEEQELTIQSSIPVEDHDVVLSTVSRGST
jgi:hypothetical protein